MTTMTVKNGIDVDRLVKTIGAIGEDPTLGEFTFRASSSWENGTHNRGRIAEFTHAGQIDKSRAAPFVLHGDEPPVLVGENNGPNAVELLLQALAFCYAVGFVANAAARGITIRSLDFEVEGEFDVRRFLGLDGPRAGFTRIRARGRVDSPDTDEATLQELFDYVLATSPVRDCLANPVPVESVLEVRTA